MAATWKGAERCEAGKQEEEGRGSAMAPAAISKSQAVRTQGDQQTCAGERKGGRTTSLGDVLERSDGLMNALVR